jgi:dienelactone hydrolase
MRARAQAGLAQLKAQPQVDATRTAAIGYCFGGGVVLELARSGANLSAVVSFHGNLDTPNPADAANINGKVLACHGAADPHVPPEQVAAFADEMNAAGVDWQLIMYGNAVHAFTDWGAGDDTSQGVAYNEAADLRSWADMQQFFGEVF